MTPEDVRVVKARALAVWADQAGKAFPAYIAELERGARDLGAPKGTFAASDAVLTATSLVSWLANVFSVGEEPPEFIVEILQDLQRATRPTLSTKAITYAEEIVRDFGEAHRQARRNGTDEDGKTPRELAERLCTMLFALVHPGFAGLQHIVEDVEDELSRFGRGRGHGVAASTVLANLNKLAGNPLDLWGADSRNVRDKKRAKKKQIPGDKKAAGNKPVRARK